MWPFKKPQPPQDTRQPSPAAKAIAYSLVHEPERWFQSDKHCDLLEHDSDISVSTLTGQIWMPRCNAPSEASKAMILEAVEKWVGKVVLLPPDDDDDDDDEEPEPVTPVRGYSLN